MESSTGCSAVVLSTGFVKIPAPLWLFSRAAGEHPSFFTDLGVCSLVSYTIFPQFSRQHFAFSWIPFHQGASALTVGLSHILQWICLELAGKGWAQHRVHLVSPHRCCPCRSTSTPTPPNSWHIQAIQCQAVFSKQLYFLILHSIYHFNLLDYCKYYLQLCWF